MISSEKTGVWSLEDVYLKANEAYWTYESDNDPGQMYVFGRGLSGTMGINTDQSRSSPTQIPGTSWQDINLGLQHSLGLKSDNTLWSWGYNGQGTLGLNDRANRSSPIQLPGTEWSSFGITSYTTLATKTDGTLWAWGDGAYGCTGINDVADISSPTQIPGTKWSKVVGGLDHVFALQNDGTAWSWGYNSYGELGINDTANRSSPYQIPGTQWTNIGGGYRTAMGLKSDNTLWSWGRNGVGGQGVNDRTNRSSPIQIGGAQWSSMADMYSYTYANFAFKSDGTMWGWGDGSYGTLGLNQQGAAGYRSSPTQIPGTEWKTAAGGYSTAVFTKTDGTAFVTGGTNGYGEMDLNEATIRRSSPTQIPGTQWDKAYANYANGGLRRKV